MKKNILFISVLLLSKVVFSQACFRIAGLIISKQNSDIVQVQLRDSVVISIKKTDILSIEPWKYDTLLPKTCSSIALKFGGQYIKNSGKRNQAITKITAQTGDISQPYNCPACCYPPHCCNGMYCACVGSSCQGIDGNCHE